MKGKHYILPAASLAIAGVVLGGQWKIISGLRDESVDLGRRLAVAREAAAPPALPAPIGGVEAPDADLESMDVAELIGRMEKLVGSSDCPEMGILTKRLPEMEPHELVSLLNQLVAMGGAANQWLDLKEAILYSLAEKDPELALKSSKNWFQDDDLYGNIFYPLMDGLGNWMEKDPAAATAWLDGEIAAGSFEARSLGGRSMLLVQLECRMLSLLLDSDLSAAKARLASMPKAMRNDVIERGVWSNYGEFPPERLAAYAEMIRSLPDSPSEKQGYLLANARRSFSVTKDLSAADEYFERIGATQEEKSFLVSRLSQDYLYLNGYNRKLTQADFNAIRTWAAAQDPGIDVNSLTGAGIGYLTGGSKPMRFSEASALALEYQESTGSDEVIIGFLERAQAKGNEEEARKLAAKISDPRQRDEALMKLK